MKITEENRQIWADLYRAAEMYRDLKPWEWLYDSDLFGVQDPVTGKIGYCCALGNLGEHIALNVYMGPEGLSSYYEMLEFGEDDPMMAGLRQNCLVVSFENRDFLSEDDRKQIKELGLKYRGANQWVMAREYAPGWFPWYISDEQAVYLTHALRQSVDVALRAEDNPDMLQFDEENVLVRVPKQTAEGLIWEDKIMDVPEIDFDIALKPNPAVWARTKKLKQEKGAMLMSLSYAPGPVRDDTKSRPFFPVMAFILAHPSKMIVAHEMFRPDDIELQLQNWMADVFINSFKAIPKQIVLPNGFAAALLEDIAEELDIELLLNPDEPAFEEVLEMMFRFL